MADRFVSKNALLICRVCKWIGEAFLWEPDETPGRPSARIDLASAICVVCQAQGKVRVLKKSSRPD